MKEAKEVPIKNQFGIEITSRLFTPTIRLFKALPVESSVKKYYKSKELVQATVNRGFMFAPEVLANYSEGELMALVDQIADEIGLSPDQMNAAFHKSWAKVRDAPLFQLVLEQIVHYFTTYGYEELGIYNPDSVFIPNEKLTIPELKDGIKLALIHGYTLAELKEKLLTMLASGIALKEQTVDDVVTIALACSLTEKQVASIRNKEARIVIYSKLDMVPANPMEFLRFMVHKTTGKSLLIADRATITAIKESTENTAYWFAKYDDVHGLKPLAEIFLRNKRIFLAFRNYTKTRPYINKIRKLADKYHIPVYTDFLNKVTSVLNKHKVVDVELLQEELKSANIFRKVRLAYALNYRMSGAGSILYRIRNGKSYATDFTFNYEALDATKVVYDEVLKSIVRDISNNVKGKRFYIPRGVRYALPATQKQFTGNIPSGTSVTVSKGMVAGVYWENVNHHRIDLDLSLLGLGEKFGWDTNYRGSRGEIMFSGDITDAPNGAVELYYIGKQEEKKYMMMMLNYFNISDDYGEVPFKIVIGKFSEGDLSKSFVMNPNNVACIAKSKIKDKQKILGLIVTTPTESKFYFTETSIGNDRTSRNNDYSQKARDYLIRSVTNTISLNEILQMAGAELVYEKDKDVIDLSPEALETDTIINLLTK